jgi:hypothetical protein
VLAMFSREGFPEFMQYGYGMPYLSDRPVGEDAYYMLTVAWNMAEKGGILYNLNKPTTGIQPLATFLYAGIAYVVQFSGGDRWSFVRAVIIVNVLLITVFARQIGNIARALMVRREAQDLASALGVVTTLSSMWVFRAFTYGLETGVYLVLIASIVLLTLRQDRRLDPVKLGLLAGVTGLARIDFGLIFGLYLLWLIKDRRLRLREAIGAGLIALLITMPWFLWVHSQTGNWMPSSGAAQSGWINSIDAPLRVEWMATALLWDVTPWVSSWDVDMRFAWAAIVLVAFLGVTLPAVHASLKGSTDPPNRWSARQLAAWSVCIAALVPAYLVAFWAWYFYGRYTAPLVVVAIPAVAVLATLAGRRLKGLPPAMLALSPAFFIVLACLQLHSGRMILDLPINAGFVRNQLDNKLRVGSSQSGTVGFFNQNVINLDGKIDPQAQYSLSHGGIRTYIDTQRIDVLLDSPAVYQTFLFAGYTGEEWQLCDRQPHAKSRCYERKPARPTR